MKKGIAIFTNSFQMNLAMNVNFLLITAINEASQSSNLPKETSNDYTALIFYVVGAIAAFYLYRKIKKKS